MSINFNGKEYENVNDLCKAYGILVLTYRRRKAYCWPDEWALDKPELFQIEEGKKFKTFNALMKSLDMTQKEAREYGSTVMDFIKYLLDNHKVNQENLLDKFKPRKHKNEPKAKQSRKVTDHKGNVHSSIKAMCEFYGVNYQTFRNRMNNHYILAWALERPAFFSVEKGVKHETYSSFCSYYNVDPANLQENATGVGDVIAFLMAGKRLSKDYVPRGTVPTLKDVKSGKVKDKDMLWECRSILKQEELNSKKAPLPKIDHNGKKFPSCKAMCAFHGISYSKAVSRWRAGYVLELCLKEDITFDVGTGIEAIDYSTFCQVHGVTAYQLQKKCKTVKEMKKYLAKKAPKSKAADYDIPKNKRGIPLHHGKTTYPSIAATARAMGIKRSDYQLFLHCIRDRRMDIEDATDYVKNSSRERARKRRLARAKWQND